MRIQRIGYGHPERPRAGELRDELRVRKHNVPPERPHAMWPRAERVDPRTAVLTRSRFVDVDGDAHGATRWQLSDGGCDFARPLLDRWFQPQGEPTRAPSEQRHVGVDYMPLPRLAYDARYCFRVRVRDTSLAWSEWSAPQRFQTTRAPLDKVAQGPARSF